MKKNLIPLIVLMAASISISTPVYAWSLTSFLNRYAVPLAFTTTAIGLFKYSYDCAQEQNSALKELPDYEKILTAKKAEVSRLNAMWIGNQGRFQLNWNDFYDNEIKSRNPQLAAKVKALFWRQNLAAVGGGLCLVGAFYTVPELLEAMRHRRY